MTFGREPITIVEIDVDQCSLRFGVGDCPAALSSAVPRKCFNTFKTCAALAAYDRSTLTLRFAYNQTGLPKIAGLYPCLQSVSTNPIELNLSGIDPRSTALGKRARVTVELADFVDDDNYTDPYQAERVSGAAQYSGVGYDTARGRFFSKLFARNPYYLGRALRIRRGYVGDAIEDMPAAHYVISELSGPDARGRVSIVAKDVLDLIDNKRAVTPAPSIGKLRDAITELSTTITLTPEGVGANYPATGLVCVGREIMRFTRVDDVLTLTERATEGTQLAAHSALDVAQICLEYIGGRACDIIHDLLTVQGPVDAAFVDLDAWRLEEDNWLGGTVFRTVIPRPTGIATLIGELCQHGVMVWWDEAIQEIRFRVNRPLAPGETATELTDAANLIEGSVDLSRAEDQRISTLQFWHGLLDPTDNIENGNNYAKLVVESDVSSASENEHGQSRIKAIYSRWFGRTGNDAFAAIIAERLVSRYRDIPTVVTGVLDVKDAGLEPADIVDITTYLVEDVTGATEAKRYQISRIERQEQRIEFRAESYDLTGRFGFWMQNPQADYDTATDEEKAEGAFWIDDAETDDLAANPYVWF